MTLLLPSEALLERCRAAGVTLTAEGETIRFRAPPGALTADLRAMLSVHKAELLGLLRGPDTTVEPHCPSCRRSVDAKRRCWHCHDRACEQCGRPTSSAFLALCLLCDMLEPLPG